MLLAGANASIAKILQEYPHVNASNSPYKSELERMDAYTSDILFLIPSRMLENAYAGKVHGLQFSAVNGTHGDDVVPTWYNPTLTYTVNGTQVPVSTIYGSRAGLFQAYQSYLVSHALTGDPNTLRNRSATPPTIEWPKLEGVPNAEVVGPVLVGRF